MIVIINIYYAHPARSSNRSPFSWRFSALPFSLDLSFEDQWTAHLSVSDTRPPHQFGCHCLMRLRAFSFKHQSHRFASLLFPKFVVCVGRLRVFTVPSLLRRTSI